MIAASCQKVRLDPRFRHENAIFAWDSASQGHAGRGMVAASCRIVRLDQRFGHETAIFAGGWPPRAERAGTPRTDKITNVGP
ncbi:hypothetical protein CS0771_20630 [Catellatospora sp. IY07-71]|nr:hypothetical protein CS0771_20630 [Catellatospora sp. IY07-71]